MTHLLLDLDTKDHVFDKVSRVEGSGMRFGRRWSFFMAQRCRGVIKFLKLHIFWGIKQMQTYSNFETFPV